MRPELSFTEISPDQLGTLKNNTFQSGSFENRFGQISADKPHRADSYISQVDSTQVGIVEITFTKPSTSQIGSTQIGSLKNRLENTDSAHSGIAQIGLSEIALTQINVGKVSSTQNNSSHITADPFNTAVTQNNTAQIQPFELSRFPISLFSGSSLYNNLAKISFPSSITADNISNENLLLRHIISLESNNTYKHNPQTLTDPNFNLTLQITDLPTGQLAEVVVTQFDQYGHPNGGTILIDHNANGLGWFIDPTPWKNSEFTQTLTDTAFRATTGEVAGKYDLLYNSVITNLSINRSLKHLHYDW